MFPTLTHRPRALSRLTFLLWAVGRRVAGAVLMGSAWACAAWMGAANAAPAQAEGARGGIYSCVDATGKRHTSDRPIAECLDREQRVLNRDGSQRRVLPPRMNAEERALVEEQERVRERARAAAKDAVRRDRNLMLRFPNEAAHEKAREMALDDVRRGIETSRKQLELLKEEREPLLAEMEFYKGRRLPQKLRSKLEANEAQQQAQEDIIQNRQAEMARVNALYDAELAHLKRLWAGHAPGSAP